MLTDRYELPLSTASSDARNAYVQGCEAKLTMYPGAIEAFDRAIAADPAFALAHTAKAHALLERGEVSTARASMAPANSLVGRHTPVKVSFHGRIYIRSSAFRYRRVIHLERRDEIRDLARCDREVVGHQIDPGRRIDPPGRSTPPATSRRSELPFADGSL
jgi:hypothetical protein